MRKDRVRKIVAQFRIGRRQQRTQFVRQEVGRFVLRDRIVVLNDALPESAIMRALRSNRCGQKKQKKS
jgi:hypothetical protein